MYTGIYINDTHLSAGICNQDQEVVFIQDEHAVTDRKYLTPCSVYIADTFAFVGHPIRYLVANDYTLDYCKDFTKDLEYKEKSVFIDNHENHWNAIGIVAILLKKLKSDLQIHNDDPFKGAVITLPQTISSHLVTSLKKAFDCVGINLCGVIDIGKAAILGYEMPCDSSKTEKIVLYNMDTAALTVSLCSLDEDNYTTTQTIETNRNLGEETLLLLLQNHIQKRYEEVTNKVVKKGTKTITTLQQTAEKVLLNYTTKSQSFIKVMCSFESPVIELIVTRAQIDGIIAAYFSQTMDFLKEVFQSSGAEIQKIDSVMMTGTSKIIKSLKPYLEKEFLEPVKFYNHNNDQIITKGTTLYANNGIEREISKSLLTQNKNDNTLLTLSKKKSEKVVLGQEEMAALVATMQINVGCEI